MGTCPTGWAITTAIPHYGLINILPSTYLNLKLARWIVPSLNFTPSFHFSTFPLINKREGGIRIIVWLLQIEVSMEHLTSIQFQEQGITTNCRRSLPVVDILVCCAVIAQTRASSDAGLERVGGVTAEGAT